MPALSQVRINLRRSGGHRNSTGYIGWLTLRIECCGIARKGTWYFAATNPSEHNFSREYRCEFLRLKYMDKDTENCQLSPVNYQLPFSPPEAHYTVYKLTDPEGKIYIGCTGQSVKDFTINMGIDGTDVSSSVSGTVYKELPQTDSEDGTGEQEFSDDVTPITEIKKVVKDEPFEYTLDISDEKWNSLIQTVYTYGLEQEWWDSPLEDVLDNILNDTRLFFAGDGSPAPLSKNQ